MNAHNNLHERKFKVSKTTFKAKWIYVKSAVIYIFSLQFLKRTMKKIFNIYYLLFHTARILGKWRSKLGQKLINFPTLWASAQTEL